MCVGVLAAALPTSATPAGKKKSRGEPAATAASNRAALQSAVMGYADSFVLQIYQVTQGMEGRLEGDAKIALLQFRFDVASSAYMIGANPNPEVALLDIVVLTNLVRRSVTAYWNPEYFGDEGARLEPVLTDLEEEVWTMARKTMSEEQEAELRRLLDEWSASHRVEWRTSAYERFSAFAETRLQNLQRPSKSKGLFGSLGQVNEAADAALLLAERGLFLLKRQPTLIVWQMQLLLARTAADPELRQALQDATSLSDSIERLAAVTESLPDTIDEQTARTLQDVDDLLDEQRRDILEALQDQEPVLRALVSDTRAAMEAGTELTRGLEAVTTSTDTLLSRLGVDAAARAPPPTLDDVQATLAAVTATSQELTRLVSSIDALLQHPSLEEEGLRDAVQRLESVTDRLVDRLFHRALVLVAISLLGAIGAALIYRWLALKMTG